MSGPASHPAGSNARALAEIAYYSDLAEAEERDREETERLDAVVEGYRVEMLGILATQGREAAATWQSTKHAELFVPHLAAEVVPPEVEEHLNALAKANAQVHNSRAWLAAVVLPANVISAARAAEAAMGDVEPIGGMSEEQTAGAVLAGVVRSKLHGRPDLERSVDIEGLAGAAVAWERTWSRLHPEPEAWT